MNKTLPLLNIKTKSGKAINPVGIGTAGYGEYGLFSPGSKQETDAIKLAVREGQNHIDTAENYAAGGAERIVGEVIKSENRQDLFVATKLWKNHVSKNLVKPAVESMLNRLKTDYIDILYIHMPWFDAPWQDAIEQINILIDVGMVRYIGVSNFRHDQLEEAINISRNPIKINQIYYNYGHRDELSEDLVSICLDNKISLVAHTPLDRGLALEAEGVKQLAKDGNIETSQAALLWILRQGISPIPKATKIKHITSNAAVYKLI